jgi:cyclopropane-fatty-acyl-phospholipid synthase
MTPTSSSLRSAGASRKPLYQSYGKEEEKRRINLHYGKPADFFQLMTGGEWNVYSCNLWENAQTDTESQTAKLNLFAALANLRPKQRILDVGCGWGGPLVYLCKTFGLSGVGLTASLPQKLATEARAESYGAEVEVFHGHWKDFKPDGKFDLIYSDEVLVHIPDLLGFFEKMKSLLSDEGSMLHKELHLSHPDYVSMSRGSSFINEIFGETGNYRVLSEELGLLAQAGFQVNGVHSMANWQYRKTIDYWLRNMRDRRAELIEAAGTEFYFNILKYLSIARLFVMSSGITIDVVCSRKCERESQPRLNKNGP